MHSGHAVEELAGHGVASTVEAGEDLAVRCLL
jgi:hypothetical protein